MVHGYALDLGGETLGSSAGLAIDPSGLALRSPHRLEVDLADLAHDGGRVWLVEVVAAQPVRSGHEPLYSAVCATHAVPSRPSNRGARPPSGCRCDRRCSGSRPAGRTW